MTLLPAPPQIIRTITRAVPEVIPLLSEQGRAALKAADIADINAGYHDAISEALISYFDGGSLAGSRNGFKRAATEAFGEAFEAGWLEGGGELPFDGEALSWFNARLEQEFSFIEGLFDEAKELKKDKEFDYFAWATSKADSYTNTLASVYNQAALMVGNNRMVTWQLGATEKHCKDCAKLDGQSHKISWFMDRNYIPHTPGASMECGGYNCDCRLIDKNGDEITT